MLAQGYPTLDKVTLVKIIDDDQGIGLACSRIMDECLSVARYFLISRRFDDHARGNFVEDWGNVRLQQKLNGALI